jgi:acetolactate synthase small subunit
MFDRRFTVQITDHPAVLARVVTVCHQRQCEITALSYRAADRHRGGELALSVRAPAYAANNLAQWLLRLVDVQGVHEAEGATTAADEPWREGPARPTRARTYSAA